MKHLWSHAGRLLDGYSCARCGTRMRRRFDTRLGCQRVIDMPTEFAPPLSDTQFGRRWSPVMPPLYRRKEPCMLDLNMCEIATGEHRPLPLENHGCTSGDVEAVFRDLPERLAREIRKYDYVFGCVAWLTHAGILEELARLRGVSLVVQKEDFLRPDTGAPRDVWGAILRRRYGQLPSLSRRQVPAVVGHLSTHGDDTLPAVRCLGGYNREKSPAFPRAHHKFVVFARHVAGRGIVPEAVWTGSFNFTENASRSFENAVILRDPKIVDAFFLEYGQMLALSEPLDWSSEWVAPEWRIGT